MKIDLIGMLLGLSGHKQFDQLVLGDDGKPMDAAQSLDALIMHHAQVRRGGTSQLVAVAPEVSALPLPELKPTSLEEAKKEAHRAVEAAERAWHTYAAMCDVGPDRTQAFQVFENVRTARRIF